MASRTLLPSPWPSRKGVLAANPLMLKPPPSEAGRVATVFIGASCDRALGVPEPVALPAPGRRLIWSDRDCNQSRNATFDRDHSIEIRSAAAIGDTLRRLGVLRLGPITAQSLGVNVNRVQLGVLAQAIVVAALGTAIGGPVVFIAMAAPILASWLSRDRIVPLWIAALCGALMLLASDTLVRVLASPHEVATGIMTRILGGLLLLRDTAKKLPLSDEQLKRIHERNAEQERIAWAYIAQLDQASVFGKRIATTVELNKPFNVEDVEKLLKGIDLEDGTSRFEQVEFVKGSPRELGVEVKGGKNQIVRRTFESLGYEVVKLDRVQFSSLTKKDLPRGMFRHLTEKEVAFLKMS